MLKTDGVVVGDAISLKSGAGFTPVGRSSVGLAFALAAIACGPEQAVHGGDSLQPSASKPTVQTSMQPQALAAQVRARAGGTIYAIQDEFDPQNPAFYVSAAITDGPTQLQRSCKTQAIDNCELVTCDTVSPGPDLGIDVGALSFASSLGTVSASPEWSDQYGFVYSAFEMKALWSSPGQSVRTIYKLRGGAPTAIRQAAPARNIVMLSSIPSVISKSASFDLSWIGQQRTDGGKIYATLLSNDNLPTENGNVLTRASLTCAAAPKQGTVVFSQAALAQLPSGGYLGLVQAESRTVDANGISHALISPIFGTVVDTIVE